MPKTQMWLITFRGETKEFTTEECNDMSAALVMAYNVASTREKEKITTDLLSLVKAMLYSRRYNFSDPEDRKDVMQEFRIGLLEALRDFDPSRNTSFFTYFQYKLRGSFTRWRYYQSELVRSKDNFFKRKLLTVSLDEEVPRSGRDSGLKGSGTTYKDLLVYSEDTDAENCALPSIVEIIIWARKYLPVKKVALLELWVRFDGNCQQVADEVGLSRQYVSIEMKRLFTKIQKARNVRKI